MVEITLRASLRKIWGLQQQLIITFMLLCFKDDALRALCCCKERLRNVLDDDTAKILERRLFFLNAAESLSDVQEGPPLWKCIEREDIPPLYSIKITDQSKLIFEPLVVDEADFSTPKRIRKIKIIDITRNFE